MYRSSAWNTLLRAAHAAFVIVLTCTPLYKGRFKGRVVPLHRLAPVTERYASWLTT